MDSYIDRSDAGRVLAEQLRPYADRNDVIVLGLPRGGVPVAYEIAKSLKAPLDIFIVRKLGVPDSPELAMGALASGGVTVLNEDIIKELRIPNRDIENVIRAEAQELNRREILYRARPLPNLKNKVIILVDDGIATGATMRAAIKALRQFKPTSIVVAVPVAAKDACKDIAKLADKMLCPMTPIYFNAVGIWYQNFEQTSDEEVRELLKGF